MKYSYSVVIKGKEGNNETRSAVASNEEEILKFLEHDLTYVRERFNLADENRAVLATLGMVIEDDTGHT